MNQLLNRTFSKRTFLFTCLGALSMPGAAAAFLDQIEKVEILKRDDLGAAVKSLFMTYDGTSKYLHKFNDVVVKSQLRSLQFHVVKGTDKEYVEHYLTTMAPLLERIKKLVAEQGDEKGLTSMFEGTSCSYQVFEHIDVEKGQRSFPCPYKEMLVVCKKYLKTFPISWEEVCGKWCTPTWTGFAEKVGMKVSVHPGETCRVALIEKPKPSA